jgi:hypothetical protein
MYSVEADKSKRLIVISAVGHVTEEEVKEAARQVREIVQDATPGFRVLSDFRWLDSMQASASRYVAEIMDAVAAKKVGLVARVISDPRKDIGLNILSQFHYGPEIQTATFETLADALHSLGEYSKD